MKPFGETTVADDTASRGLWRAIRDVTAFAATKDLAERPVWRISTAPSKGAELVRLIGDCEVLYDWGGGLLWVMMASADDAGAERVRRAVSACVGQATLIRAPAAIRAAVSVFEPQGEGLAGLTRRIKQSFDPNGVLNPGRMWAGV
jgi:glycolate oxidase FAD binding subunit